MTNNELLQQDLEYHYGKGVEVVDADEIIIDNGIIKVIKINDK